MLFVFLFLIWWIPITIPKTVGKKYFNAQTMALLITMASFDDPTEYIRPTPPKHYRCRFCVCIFCFVAVVSFEIIYLWESLAIWIVTEPYQCECTRDSNKLLHWYGNYIFCKTLLFSPNNGRAHTHICECNLCKLLLIRRRLSTKFTL